MYEFVFIIFIIFLTLLIPITIIIRIINKLREDLLQTNFILYRIAKQIGVIDSPVENMSDINTKLKELISKNKRMEAIKLFRVITGKNLKEAKDYINNLD